VCVRGVCASYALRACVQLRSRHGTAGSLAGAETKADVDTSNIFTKSETGGSFHVIKTAPAKSEAATFSKTVYAGRVPLLPPPPTVRCSTAHVDQFRVLKTGMLCDVTDANAMRRVFRVCVESFSSIYCECHDGCDRIRAAATSEPHTPDDGSQGSFARYAYMSLC
jgi:hypothetical protein